MTDFEFSSLSLPPAQLSNLADLGYARMTPIQAETLPHLLKNKDLIAQAKTGSGKTAAFGIGLLAKLNVRQYQVQSLIICPTRELAKQVAQEIKRLARFQQNIKVLTLCGGSPFGPQLGSLEHGAHIVVGTPGRIKEHLRKGSLSLDKVNTLVLDEADRMLDMGFHDAISDIIENTPKSRQTLLFSATYPEGIQDISNKFQHKPIEVSVEAVHSQNDIEQLFYEVKKHERNNAL
ncbi:MAG: DEAD/DEAH box helicase, partial [Gammaproteobacteria bacterium]|nr:DEAD/DEAH box helicase [Gammaproteobacteria bacterium]